jgi:muramidase (phage lysozyme)
MTLKTLLGMPLTAALMATSLMSVSSAQETPSQLFIEGPMGSSLQASKESALEILQEFGALPITAVKYEHLTPDNLLGYTVAKLHYLGYLDPSVNSWSDQTVEALIKFQRDYQQPSSGVLTEATKLSLFNAEPGSYSLLQEWEDSVDAYQIDLQSLHSSDVAQKAQRVQQILVLRKLRDIGFYHGQGIANLNHLTARGQKLLDLYKKPEAQAFLEMISYAEGTQRQPALNSFLVRFGGALISSFKQHPNIIWGGISSATGKFQFMDYTWPGVAHRLGARDFTPLAQSLGALHQMAHKQGLNTEDLTGNFDSNVFKAAREWASLPCGPNQGSCYSLGGAPQPNKSLSALRTRYEQYLERHRTNPEFNQLVHWGEDEIRALREFNYAYQINTNANYNNLEVLQALFEGQLGNSGTPDILP